MNDSVTSDFSKVKFHDIPESYGIAETVTLQYTIASDHEPNAKDWIGLYRVGWKSIKEYVTYEWISLPDSYTPGTQVECVCVFKDNLPKNDEDFFQFCYVNTQSKVCGASSPFQFLEDYDIVVISETESMLVIETNHAGQAKQRTTAEATQHSSLPGTEEEEELVIVEDEVKRITGELTETKRLLAERDSQLKDLGSEVNQLQSKLKQSEGLSSQLAEDVDRLKSELLDEKEKQILMEKTFSEREKHLKKTFLEASEREFAYKEKEKQLNASVQHVQKQLCEKAQELELFKMEYSALKRDHSANLSMLEVKQQAVEDLTKRCSRMSTEISQMKKMTESPSKLEMKQKPVVHHPGEMKHLQVLSSKDVESWMNQVGLEKHVEFRRNAANAELVTDGVENVTPGSGKIQKESFLSKMETDSCSTDQFDGNGSVQSGKTCEVCFLTFPLEVSVQVFKDHLQSHKKVCPICNKQFAVNYTQEEFEIHVSEHLSNTIIFPDGHRICPMCNLKCPPAWSQDQFEIHVNNHFTETVRP